jgi:hypothetical protein
MNPVSEEIERKLKALFDQIDDYLERKYGHLYPLHPSRPRYGKTANREHDGLFNIGAAFTAGYGSEKGRGYVIDVDLVTLSHVPLKVQVQIEAEVFKEVQKLLPEFFPERELHVDRDGRIYKIYGDLSLGTV